ncbi:MAG: hypothetical protein J2P19_05730 [Pseudonocardia sp.]|nr:hypothetical protein [Pseudonocardia sp.]
MTRGESRGAVCDRRRVRLRADPVDLAYPDPKLAVEYDGPDHLERPYEERVAELLALRAPDRYPSEVDVEAVPALVEPP